MSKGQETCGRGRGKSGRGREKLKGRAFTEPGVGASSNRHPKASEGFLSKARPWVSEFWLGAWSRCQLDLTDPVWQGDSLAKPFCGPDGTQLFWDVCVIL